MADCYIVRRGGTGGGKDDENALFSIGLLGLISPIDDVTVGGRMLEKILYVDTAYTPADIYQNGELWNTTPAERISVVDLASPVTIDGFTADSAVKIYGAGVNSITYGWNFTINCPAPKGCILYIGVSAEGSTYDLAYVELNGAQTGSYTTSSGTLTTHKIPLELSAGDNRITVKYRKDGSSSKGDDCVYIYGIETGSYKYE